MGFSVWSAQPLTIVASRNGSAITLSTHVTDFGFGDNAEGFTVQDNNKKYPQFGGNMSHSHSVSWTTYDARRVAGNGHYRAGNFFGTCSATFASEGPSANSGSYGTLTVSWDGMHIDSVQQGDGGGRSSYQISATVYSSDGLDPLAFAVA